VIALRGLILQRAARRGSGCWCVHIRIPATSVRGLISRQSFLDGGGRRSCVGWRSISRRCRRRWCLCISDLLEGEQTRRPCKPDFQRTQITSGIEKHPISSGGIHNTPLPIFFKVQPAASSNIHQTPDKVHKCGRSLTFLRNGVGFLDENQLIMAFRAKCSVNTRVSGIWFAAHSYDEA
jgi:hypothetical protein